MKSLEVPLLVQEQASQGTQNEDGIRFETRGPFQFKDGGGTIAGRGGGLGRLDRAARLRKGDALQPVGADGFGVVHESGHGGLPALAATKVPNDCGLLRMAISRGHRSDSTRPHVRSTAEPFQDTG
ncbi:MAG: hypothetical protein ACK55I_38260, partial [bacterium]